MQVQVQCRPKRISKRPEWAKNGSQNLVVYALFSQKFENFAPARSARFRKTARRR